jgi:hypothetical protein
VSVGEYKSPAELFKEHPIALQLALRFTPAKLPPLARHDYISFAYFRENLRFLPYFSVFKNILKKVAA